MGALAHKTFNATVPLAGLEMFVMKLSATHLVKMVVTVLYRGIVHVNLIGKVQDVKHLDVHLNARMVGTVMNLESVTALLAGKETAVKKLCAIILA